MNAKREEREATGLRRVKFPPRQGLRPGNWGLLEGRLQSLGQVQEGHCCDLPQSIRTGRQRDSITLCRAAV